MDAIRTVRANGPWIPGNVKSRAAELSNGQTSSQESSTRSYQEDSTSVQQRISDSLFQFIESKEVKLDFEINCVGGKIAVRVINEATEKVIRQFTVKPEVIMDGLKGVIYQTIA